MAAPRVDAAVTMLKLHGDGVAAASSDAAATLSAFPTYAELLMAAVVVAVLGLVAWHLWTLAVSSAAKPGFATTPHAGKSKKQTKHKRKRKKRKADKHSCAVQPLRRDAAAKTAVHSAAPQQTDAKDAKQSSSSNEQRASHDDSATAAASPRPSLRSPLARTVTSHDAVPEEGRPLAHTPAVDRSETFWGKTVVTSSDLSSSDDEDSAAAVVHPTPRASQTRVVSPQRVPAPSGSHPASSPVSPSGKAALAPTMPSGKAASSPVSPSGKAASPVSSSGKAASTPAMPSGKVPSPAMPSGKVPSPARVIPQPQLNSNRRMLEPRPAFAMKPAMEDVVWIRTLGPHGVNFASRLRYHGIAYDATDFLRTHAPRSDVPEVRHYSRCGGRTSSNTGGGATSSKSSSAVMPTSAPSRRHHHNKRRLPPPPSLPPSILRHSASHSGSHAPPSSAPYRPPHVSSSLSASAKLRTLRQTRSASARTGDNAFSSLRTTAPPSTSTTVAPSGSSSHGRGHRRTRRRSTGSEHPFTMAARAYRASRRDV